ncbi:hypothetical protein THAOC_08881 [Thalassiosira oceanica]|uniref:Uncharacterized protein n=1 Tax=Thalassiosira oceanica TaxID=159749 RepID=K0STW9_THAOC|nr:hypothetical protein THAOC_08881 [Thalassiosira oceanica]|eukprot:EJK69828.1 hypothetical protein THAOC_08881 [Thalassiosira oceanica]
MGSGGGDLDSAEEAKRKRPKNLCSDLNSPLSRGVEVEMAPAAQPVALQLKPIGDFVGARTEAPLSSALGLGAASLRTPAPASLILGTGALTMTAEEPVESMARGGPATASGSSATRAGTSVAPNCGRAPEPVAIPAPQEAGRTPARGQTENATINCRDGERKKIWDGFDVRAVIPAAPHPIRRRVSTRASARKDGAAWQTQRAGRQPGGGRVPERNAADGGKHKEQVDSHAAPRSTRSAGGGGRVPEKTGPIADDAPLRPSLEVNGSPGGSRSGSARPRRANVTCDNQLRGAGSKALTVWSQAEPGSTGEVQAGVGCRGGVFAGSDESARWPEQSGGGD